MTKNTEDKKHVLVRTKSAGVHFGRLLERHGLEVLLADARRIWSWQGANTLHEIALHGVGRGSKISEAVSTIVLTEAIELLACSAQAVASLEAATWGE